MTIPNLITIIRIILTPLFIICLINDKLTTALIIFIVAGLSDGADGLAARLLEQKTRLGSYLDPLADKILLVAAFVALGVRGIVPTWVTVAVISRDVLILLGVLILFLSKGFFIRIHPSILSKVTTCFQLGTVFIVLAKAQFPCLVYLIDTLFFLTVMMTIGSGLHYMIYWFKMMNEGPQGEPPQG